MELQEPTTVMMAGYHIPPTPPEPIPPQIPSTPFKVKEVHLFPIQLKELKLLNVEQDKQRSKGTADEDWSSLLDCAQCLFQASSILF